MLTCNTISKIQGVLEGNDAGFRKQKGRKLVNTTTGETVYEPPQDYNEIQSLMADLEKFINDDESYGKIDPLIKMAIIHYQFETIHPFSDGNGRTGRIINVLYLVLKNLLDKPILYLSRYIIDNKQRYYELLQGLRTGKATWEDWILYMLTAVEVTSKYTMEIVSGIRTAMMETKHLIRAKHKFYSQDLINTIFRNPYTKVKHLQDSLGVSRVTATSYLEKLTEDKILEKHSYGKYNYYINIRLLRIVRSVGRAMLFDSDSIESVNL